MSLEEAKQFVARFTAGDFSPEEHRDFLRWLSRATSEEIAVIADQHESLQGDWILSLQPPTDEWVVTLEGKLDRASSKEVIRLDSPFIEKRSFRRRKIWVAAASVAILLSAGTYMFVKEKGQAKGESSLETIAYTSTYYTGRGDQQKALVLADGTKVWLNSASSLKYGMTGKQRVAELSGEAFFQVALDSEHPFHVRIKDAEVEVLGTDFNVMAYEDEPISRTTLVQGVVRLESGSQEVELKPGQQAEIVTHPKGAEAIKVTKGVSTVNVASWKDGSIPIEDEGVRAIMRKISRLYNVDITVDPNVPDTHLSGTLSRSSSLDKILRQLQGYLNIHCTNNGKTVTVSI